MAAKEQANAKKADEVNTNYMKMGTVSEIRKNGAVAMVKDSNPESDKVEKYFVPGWAYRHVNTPKGQFLTTTQGVGLSVGDLINFYIDPKLEAKPYDAVACNVDILKHAEKPAVKAEKKGAKVGSVNSRKKLAPLNWKKFLLSESNDDEYNSEADPDFVPQDSEDSSEYDSEVSEDEIKELCEASGKDLQEIIESLPKENAPKEINENEPISKVAEIIVDVPEVEVAPTA